MFSTSARSSLLQSATRFIARYRRILIAITLGLAAAYGFMAIPDASMAAKYALIVFTLAIICWTLLAIDETPVAIGAALVMVAADVIQPATFYSALGSDLIWLLIGGFLLASSVTQSGLAERFASAISASARNVDSLMTRLTWLIVATAFFVPSTSARAVLLLPVFLGLAGSLQNPRLTRALALLFPTIILLSACASMLGAGAHLVAVDFMRRVDGTAPNFVRWIFLAGPFAAASSYVAMKTVTWMFLTRAERQTAVTPAPAMENPKPSAYQRNLIVICVVTLAAWMTGDMHGIEPAIVGIVGALAATTRSLTGIDMKAAIKKVEWNLIFFLAGTLVLGAALQESGAAKVLANLVFKALPAGMLNGYAVVVVCIIVALVSHTFITSRTVRATVLIPAFAIPLATEAVSASLLILAVTIGSGFCQTFIASAKPVAIFAKTEVPTFDTSDLLRLSAVLFIPILALLLIFSFFVWPMLGLR